MSFSMKVFVFLSKPSDIEMGWGGGWRGVGKGGGGEMKIVNCGHGKDDNLESLRNFQKSPQYQILFLILGGSIFIE